MNHILDLGGRLPPPAYPHFQPPNKGGSDRGGFVTRTPYPSSQPEEGPEWKAPPEYDMVTDDFRCPDDP
jgi:hypothetical protein